MMSEYSQQREIHLETVVELSLGSPVSMMRALVVQLSPNQKAILAVYSACYNVDPFWEMFFFPTDTLKLALFTEDGQILWKRDLGKGVIPGRSFCPVYAFDLDGDGTDEIWFINNVKPEKPLTVTGHRLERLDSRTGETTGQWPWVYKDSKQPLSRQFRNYIMGGYANGKPVLVTAQGTYQNMFLQGWNANMSSRWEVDIPGDSIGARGSHMCPVVDINGDGIDELLWGERCFELDCGRELFCADRDSYRGHSDVIQPVYEAENNRWTIFTCRESDPQATPRVVLFDDKGMRVWGEVEQGHMDMGWVAHLGEHGEQIAVAIRIGGKTAGPDGRVHEQPEEFLFDARTGKKLSLPFSIYLMVPVDLNGDGIHELVRGVPGGNGEVLNRMGERLGELGGTVALASKFMNRPGEQVLCYYPDGTIRIWADRNAVDSEQAKIRYNNRLYAASQRLMASGYNLMLTAGI